MYHKILMFSAALNFYQCAVWTDLPLHKQVKRNQLTYYGGDDLNTFKKNLPKYGFDQDIADEYKKAIHNTNDHRKDINKLHKTLNKNFNTDMKRRVKRLCSQYLGHKFMKAQKILCEKYLEEALKKIRVENNFNEKNEFHKKYKDEIFKRPQDLTRSDEILKDDNKISDGVENLSEVSSRTKHYRKAKQKTKKGPRKTERENKDKMHERKNCDIQRIKKHSNDCIHYSSKNRHVLKHISLDNINLDESSQDQLRISKRTFEEAIAPYTPKPTKREKPTQSSTIPTILLNLLPTVPQKNLDLVDYGRENLYGSDSREFQNFIPDRRSKLPLPLPKRYRKDSAALNFWFNGGGFRFASISSSH